MQNDLISAYNQMAKKLSAPQKKKPGKLQGVPKFRKLKGLVAKENLYNEPN
jgi:hypothetical protein